MARVAYVNGRYRPVTDTAIGIEDRGFQFGDGIYEVWTVRAGRFLDHKGHQDRLVRSLKELRIDMPVGLSALNVILGEIVRRNHIRDGLVYLQVTRGVSRRDHPFPKVKPRPTLVITARPIDLAAAAARAEAGIGVITAPDLRWKRCDIKTTNLLPNVLAKQAAREAGAFEAWLVDEDGYVTEGSSSNAWIVTRDGALVTRQEDERILWGVTRLAILALAEAEGLRIEQRPFTPQEALDAREAFVTSASTFATPVVSIDGRPVANGAPGSVATRLRELYLGSDATV